jgi:hypothetical protein
MFQFNLLLKQFILPFCFRNALFLIFMLVTFSANAQSTQIQGEMCGTSLLHNQRLQKDPAFAARVQSDEKGCLQATKTEHYIELLAHKYVLCHWLCIFCKMELL